MLRFEFTESAKQYVLLKTADKIVYEFSVNLDEEDKFLWWVEVLSSPEFKVDVDLNNINTNKKYYSERVLFRVRVSGAKPDLDRWDDNLRCVSKFLRGEYDITYFKKIEEQDE